MQRTEPDRSMEFRHLLGRLQWDTQAFARAARIKARAAAEMWHAERDCPEQLMEWLRRLVGAVDQVPPPPDGER